MKTEDAFVVAAIVTVMFAGCLGGFLEIHRLNSEVDRLTESQPVASAESLFE